MSGAPPIAWTRRRAVEALVGVAAFGSLAGSGLCATAGQAPAPAPTKGTAAPSPANAWLSLPPTPPLPPPLRSGLAEVNGTKVFYAQFGSGPNVLLLHGGLGSSNYWGHQIVELEKRYTVTVMDTRGHGRSPVTSRLFSFELFAQDVSGVLDLLGMSDVAVVGWSDGAITGLELALKQERRMARLFAFGANATLDGTIHGGSRNKVFAAYAARCRAEYRTLSPSPERWNQLVAGLGPMWRREPSYSRAQLANITIPVTIADGEHDEIIRPEHTKWIAGQIPGARLVMLPGVSHFAMLQNPVQFNAALIAFLQA
jgi:pimeloyl-ACP methyl ester carboxylesterase